MKTKVSQNITIAAKYKFNIVINCSSLGLKQDSEYAMLSFDGSLLYSSQHWPGHVLWLQAPYSCFPWASPTSAVC